MAMTKVKKLQQWCKQMVDGYPEVAVTDMTASWKNGLAFCAIIHRFRPDLIDFDSLSKENVFENNQLAFEVAENELGISALLEAEDMVAIRVPDRLSVVTYVSQYYNYFHDKPKLGGPGVNKINSLKRHKSPDDMSGPEPKRLTPQNNTKSTERKNQGSLGDKCTLCHEKVYLLERLMENNKLHHRTCFRQSDLSPTSKIYARPSSPGGPRRGRGSEKSANLVARLNELKKSTAAFNPSVNKPTVSNKIDNKNSDPAIPAWKQSHSDNQPKVVSPRIGTPREEISHKVSPARDFGGNQNVVHMDTSVGGRESPVSPGAKPKARPRGSIKSKEDSKLDKKEDVKAPPRKKMLKSDTSSNADSPPALPTSTPPSLRLAGDIQNSTSPPPRPRFNAKGPSPETRSPATTDKHPSDLNQKPSSSPRFKNSLNSESPGDTTTSLANLKTNSKILSGRKENDPTIDNAPPKPPRSLPRGTTPKDMEQAGKLSDQDSLGAVTPETKRDQGDNVLSGLLKNLANVRHKGDGANENSPKNTNKLANLNTPGKSASDLPVTVPDRAKPRVMKRAVIPSSKVTSDTVTPNSKVTSDTVTPNSKVTSDTVTPSSKVTSDTVTPRSKVSSATVTPRSKVSSATVVEDVKATERGPTKQARKMDKFEKFENKNAKETTSEENSPAWKIQRNLKAKTDENGGKNYSQSSDQDNASNSVVKNLANNYQGEDRKTAYKGGNKDRPARPKTPEVLSKKHTKDNVSVSSGQIEAEKKNAKGDTEAQRREFGVTGDKQKTNKTPEIKSKVSLIPSEIKSESSKKKITVDVKFNFEEADSNQKSPKSPRSPRPPRPPQPSPHDIKEPRRSIKKHRSPNAPGSPGWLKDGDFRKMSPFEIQNQLVQIDSKLTDLEIRGRHLEDSIRKAPEEDENMMIEWFQMVNEKNELIRKEADLIYASRTQELEDEQQGIDRQIRELLQKPDGEKTEEEKKEEELLLQKLIDVVNQRSVIVDSQDEDRIRYQEEDRDIAVMLENKGFVQKTH